MSNCDLSGFVQMVEDFKRLEKEYDAFLRGFLVEIGQRALARTIKRTPVDTGALKRRWKLSPPYRIGDDLEIMIGNDIEYAMFVELGHRIMKGDIQVGYVEGYHMATISIAEIERQIPLRYEKAWKEFCGRILRG